LNLIYWTGLYKKPELSREPLHVPLAGSLNILHHHLKGIEVVGSNGVEAHIEEDEGPFEERVDRVSLTMVSTRRRSPRGTQRLTTSNSVHLVLDEEVDQRHKSTEEQASKPLAVFDRLRVRRAEGNAAQCPRECRDDV
jgi:hypothetical protein